MFLHSNSSVQARYFLKTFFKIALKVQISKSCVILSDVQLINLSIIASRKEKSIDKLFPPKNLTKNKPRKLNQILNYHFQAFHKNTSIKKLNIKRLGVVKYFVSPREKPEVTEQRSKQKRKPTKTGNTQEGNFQKKKKAKNAQQPSNYPLIHHGYNSNEKST